MANSSSQEQQASPHNPTPELSRELSLYHITMMGLGMMIGAGVFLGMGISIGKAGPGGVVLTFALNGVLAIFTAMSFAELSSAIPRAGGAYNFARIGFGRGTSFLAGWMEWFASSVAGAMYALTFSLYTIRFINALGLLDGFYSLLHINPESDIFLKIIAVVTAATFIYINYRGASETGKIGAMITMGQTIFVVFIGIVGVFTVIKDPSRLNNFVPFMPEGWSKLLVTMGFTYVAFEGFEVIAQAGDEAIDPRRNLPKAMINSVLIVTVIYILVAFATVVSVKAGPDITIDGQVVQPWQWIGQFGPEGFGSAIAKLISYKNIGNFILTLAVIFSSTSALNATVFSATRASYALGRDKMLPSFFAKIHKTRNTPYGALICTAVIILFVATMLPTKDVASSASIMFIFLFFLVNLCVIKIRRSMSDEMTYGYMMPLFPIFPILAILCQVILAVELREMSHIALIVAPIWVVVGIAVYFFYSRSRAVTTEEDILVLEEQKAIPSDKYRVMVAIANPANATALVQGTYKLCGAKDAQVELIHMLPVPDQVALTDAKKYMTPGKEALMEAMLSLSLHFTISTTIRYCRNIARGIVSAIRQKKTQMLVLGWHGKSSKGIFNLGATVDPIIEQTPCDVVVMKDCSGNKTFENVLVPVAGGPNSAFALEIATIMAETENSTITAFTVDRGNETFNLDQFLDVQAEQLSIRRGRFKSKTVKAKSTVLAILKESREHDLVVLGTTNKPMLVQMARQSLPEKIACRCKTPLVMVKKGQGVRSWIKRWI